MRSSSTRLRFGGALAATSIALVFGLGGTALADQGQGDEHRNERTDNRDNGSAVAADEQSFTENTDTNDGDTPNNVPDAGDNAHPSGNDRSVENGASGNQGDANSEPDQDDSGPERDIGGNDAPNGPGGGDLSDQDGNNGCGNDDDFDDDNEGLCGRPVKPVTPPVADSEAPIIENKVVENNVVENNVVENKVVETGAVASDAVLATQLQSKAPAVVAAQVLGVAVERPASIEMAAAADTSRPTAVLGAASVRGSGLARTGSGATAMVLIAMSLLLVGFAMVRRSKSEHFTA